MTTIYENQDITPTNTSVMTIDSIDLETNLNRIVRLLKTHNTMTTSQVQNFLRNLRVDTDSNPYFIVDQLLQIAVQRNLIIATRTGKIRNKKEVIEYSLPNNTIGKQSLLIGKYFTNTETNEIGKILEQLNDNFYLVGFFGDKPNNTSVIVSNKIVSLEQMSTFDLFDYSIV